MAKNEAAAKESRANTVTEEIIPLRDENMPAGFQHVTPDESGERSWWKPAAGLIVTGRLIGRFERRDGGGAYYQVQLSAPTEAIQGKGDDAKTVTLVKGATVNVDERTSMEQLKRHTDSDGIFDVFIKAIEKIKISGGRTYWQINCGVKTIKAASHPLRDLQPGRTDDMGAPF